MTTACSMILSSLHLSLSLFSSFIFLSSQEMKEQGENRKRRGRDEGDDAEHSSGVRKKVRGGKFARGKSGVSRRGR